MKYAIRFTLAAAAVAAAVVFNTPQAETREAVHVAAFDEAAAAQMPQECDPRGCGYIDFDAHPELIGGGLVLEGEEQGK